ncbi:Na+/H+ antiporter NhaA [Stackebrandtia endophytica]|uniref:Na(+)/H(+) antiporter NhaA n=1 Tax=Stackebrandtia endophytica TaxID=1496996 RepID=A0A543AUH2_9ACTN|nr:Na+/H+ antiporter NhaA [Stackebrandtia endophytica]TQL76205.1 Na+/H+ antiporter NhaA [Stackebrandtia endophytica]
MPETIPAMMQRHAPRRRRIDPDVLAAIVLACATLVALLWANLSDSYNAVWDLEAGFTVGDVDLSMTLGHWVNEALMAIFFFAVGLDVRRDLSIGELRQRERAILSVCGAVGGLIVPAAVFFLFTAGTAGAVVWGAVISTDTAFALGMLALVGPRNAPRLRVFLLTLAVVDDVGALSVIAIFYTDHLNLFALGGVAVGLGVIWLLQRNDVGRVTPYLAVGIVTWLAMYASGVHATLAGVLIALLIPVYPTSSRDVEAASRVVHLFRQAPVPKAARIARHSISQSISLNQRLGELLPPYVNFLIVPLFALANAGVILSGDMLSAAMTSYLTWGIVAGLVLGKLVGITFATELVQRLVPAARAPGLDLPRVAGIAALAGMGFTISLLVVDIGLTDPQLRDEARMGVLLASFIALGVAWLIFKVSSWLKPLPLPTGIKLQRGIDGSRDHMTGPAKATSSIVVYTAMSSAYRNRTAEAIAEVKTHLGDKVNVVYRHHTDTDEELTMAIMLEAAGAQRKFWELHDAIIARRAPVGDEDLVDLAEEAGLHTARFLHDVNTYAHLARVDDDNLDAQAAGLPDSPVLYLDGVRLKGPANSWHIATVLQHNREKKPTDGQRPTLRCHQAFKLPVVASLCGSATTPAMCW